MNNSWFITVKKYYPINPPLEWVVKGKVVEGAQETLEKLMRDFRVRFHQWCFQAGGSEIDMVHILNINPWLEERSSDENYNYERYGFSTFLHFSEIAELLAFLARLDDEVVEIKFDGFGLYGLFGDTCKEPRFSTGGGVSKDKAIRMVGEFVEGVAERVRDDLETRESAKNDAETRGVLLEAEIAKLQAGVRVAITELEHTKGMFKSKKIAEIREDLERVVSSR